MSKLQRDLEKCDGIKAASSVLFIKCNLCSFFRIEGCNIFYVTNNIINCWRLCFNRLH